MLSVLSIVSMERLYEYVDTFRTLRALWLMSPKSVKSSESTKTHTTFVYISQRTTYNVAATSEVAHALSSTNKKGSGMKCTVWKCHIFKLDTNWQKGTSFDSINRWHWQNQRESAFPRISALRNPTSKMLWFLSLHRSCSNTVYGIAGISQTERQQNENRKKLNQILENQFVIERNTLFRWWHFGRRIAVIFLIVIRSRSWSAGMRRGTIAMTGIGCIVLIVGRRSLMMMMLMVRLRWFPLIRWEPREWWWTRMGLIFGGSIRTTSQSVMWWSFGIWCRSFFAIVAVISVVVSSVVIGTGSVSIVFIIALSSRSCLIAIVAVITVITIIAVIPSYSTLFVPRDRLQHIPSISGKRAFIIPTGFGRTGYRLQSPRSGSSDSG